VGRRIARTSGTPGKTQLLNVFRLPELYLLDLPGYGYARASHAERRRFRSLVEGVLERRPLAAVVWLLDIRHPPSTDDRAMRELLLAGERPIVVTLTKADKLSRAQADAALARRIEELGIDPDTPPLVTSAARGLGIVPLAEAIRELVARAPAR
jgi:GTP-binding protein